VTLNTREASSQRDILGRLTTYDNIKMCMENDKVMINDYGIE
jgi:hypothetical protein